MRRFLNCNDKGGIVETPQWQPSCWVNIESPDEADFALMMDRLKIPHDFIESVHDPDERPRIERQDGWVMAIIRIPVEDRNPGISPFRTIPMGIMIKDDTIVSLCSQITPLVPDFIEHTHQKQISLTRPTDYILRLVYAATYWYLRYLKVLNDQVMRAENSLRRDIRNDDLIDLMGIQQALVYFNTSIKGNEVLLERIEKAYDGQFDTDLFSDIEVEIKQADNTVVVYTDILSGIMDSFGSIISNNVNDIMKKMTGVSIVLMLPTLIASFYGMNVPVVGGASSATFWLIVAGSVALSALLYFLLRKIKWL